MSLERRIKEAFERHAADVQPAPGAWSRIEARVRRTRMRRLAAGSTLAAAAAVAVAFAVPALLRGPAIEPGPITPPASPTAEPSPTPPPDPLIGFRNERDAYQLLLPADWRVGEFEAAALFWPQSLPSLPEGGPTFGVEIQGRWGEEPAGVEVPGEPEPEAADPARFGGRPFIRNEQADPEGGRRVFYRVAWQAPCPPGASCPAEIEDLALLVILAGTTDALWEEYGAAGEALAASIEPAGPAGSRGTVEGAPVLTRRGVVEDGVAYDDLTATLVRFLDARLEAWAAEDLLADTARGQYEAGEGGLRLYPEDFWSGYVVWSREDVDASSAEFTVLIQTQAAGPTWPRGPAWPGEGLWELLGAGPTADAERPGILIRFAAAADPPPGAGS